MTEKKQIRLSHLKISNYKRIDSLEIDFLPPLMQGDPDILLLGSKNGGGKTSVLECCSLLTLSGLFREHFRRRFKTDESLLDIANLLVKAGQDLTSIEGRFNKGNQDCNVSLTINRREILPTLNIEGDESLFEINKKDEFNTFDLNSIFASSGEPLIIPPLLHFNSYRKVQELNPELGMMADDYPRSYDMRRRSGTRNNPVSSFKLEILRSLMGQASLFEDTDKEQSQNVLSQLNYLIQR